MFAVRALSRLPSRLYVPRAFVTDLIATLNRAAPGRCLASGCVKLPLRAPAKRDRQDADALWINHVLVESQPGVERTASEAGGSQQRETMQNTRIENTNSADAHPSIMSELAAPVIQPASTAGAAN